MFPVMNTILIPILQVISVALNFYRWVVLVAVIASLVLPPLASFVGQHFQLNIKPTAAVVSQ